MSAPAISVDPRAARRQARFDGILDAAWDIARTEGLTAVTLHEVARRVGLRQPSLYAYIDSKAGLYDAMFAQGYRTLVDRLRALSDEVDARQAVVDVSRAFLEFAVEDAARQQLLFQRTIPGFAPSAESYALAEACVAIAAERVRPAGITDPADFDVYTALVAGLTAQQIANEPGGTRWTRHLEAVLDMFLSSLEPKESP